MSIVGIRVIREPHWKWGNEDGEVGNLGSVCKQQSIYVTVKWDKGKYKTYKPGSNNLYDLRIYDNSCLGVKHNNVCKGCDKGSILGLRYQCSVCNFYDLCASCYHENKHDTNHMFALFPTNTVIGMSLPPRLSSKTDTLASGSKYYLSHLPVLGKNYLQFNKMNKLNIETERLEATKFSIFDDLLNNLEKKYGCVICRDDMANTIFDCLHRSCLKCALRLTHCHICREIIKVDLMGPVQYPSASI